MSRDDVTESALIRSVADRLDGRADEANLVAWTIGPRQVCVELSHPTLGRLAGVAHRPPGGDVDIAGCSVPEIVAQATEDRRTTDRSLVSRALGIAALNALSSPDIDWEVGDPMAQLPDDIDVVATVGLFRPAFSKFGGREVRVVEREPVDDAAIPDGVDASVYPPDEATEAFTGADLCFLTGSTLIYGGLGAYLTALLREPAAAVVLIGATASMLPDPFFAAGIDVVAGARVDDIEAVTRGIEDGECGTDLHDRGLTKVYVDAPTGRQEADPVSRSGEIRIAGAPESRDP